jgi:DNA-nicking Smr family endonuclease
VIDQNEDVTHIPIDGVLDLHTFDPRELPSLIDDYLEACMEKGIYEVRIIHGKGKGVLRRRVQALLERHPLVTSFKLDSGASGWGTTVVHLKSSL